MATSEVEKSISIIAMFPSSLLKILEKGSVWYMRKPREVPETVSYWLLGSSGSRCINEWRLTNG